MAAQQAQPLPECAGPCGLPMRREDHARHDGWCPSCRAVIAHLDAEPLRLALHREIATPHSAR